MKKRIPPGLFAFTLLAVALLAADLEGQVRRPPAQSPEILEEPGCQTDADCPNTNLCEGRNLCQPGLGRCFRAGPPVVDDGNPCTIDYCNPSTGVVSHLTILPGMLTCPAAPSVCGNKIVEAQEECEPPNTIACDKNCRFVVIMPPPSQSPTLPAVAAEKKMEEKKPSLPPPAPTPPPVPPPVVVTATKGEPVYFCFTGEIVAFHSVTLQTVDLSEPCPQPPAEAGKTIPDPNPSQERLVQAFERYDEGRNTENLKQVQEAIGNYISKTVGESKPALMKLIVPLSQEGIRGPSKLAEIPVEFLKSFPSSFRYEEGELSGLQLFNESDPTKKDYLLILADGRPYYARGGCARLIEGQENDRSQNTLLWTFLIPLLIIGVWHSLFQNLPLLTRSSTKTPKRESSTEN